MTTILLTGGPLGSEKVRVQCDLSQASSPVRVDYHMGNGWESTQYQCADCRHRIAGLVAVGEELVARAVDVPIECFSCDWEIQ